MNKIYPDIKKLKMDKIDKILLENKTVYREAIYFKRCCIKKSLKNENVEFTCTEN